MTPERLLAPFTDKRKEVSSEASGSETGTEDQDRERNLGQRGTGLATGANGTCNTVCGHPKVDDKSPVTTVGAKKWSVPSVEFGFPTGNGRTSQLERGSGQERRTGPKLSRMLNQ